MSIPLRAALPAVALLVAACGDRDLQAPPGDPLQVEFTLMGGESARLADYRGRVLLLVNVASRCGFTPQYEGLQALHERYGSEGLTIIGFPANDFMNQEPGGNEEILAFCRSEFGVDFPMAEKIRVKGESMHPLYRHLTGGLGDPRLAGEISWNFNKFLLGRDGGLRARFGSRTAPREEELVAAIEAALAERAP